MNWRTPILAACLLAVGAACNSDTGTTTSMPAGSGRSASEVAAAFVTAMGDDDFEAAAALTFVEQMPWVVMAEGGSLTQAAALEVEDLDTVAANYWEGFDQAAQLPEISEGEVEETSVGGNDYALVSLGSRLRLVLRNGGEWQVDVIASFAPTIANRLLEAAEVVEANGGEAATRMGELFAAQLPSVELAALSSGLPTGTQDDMRSLLDLLEDLSEGGQPG